MFYSKKKQKTIVYVLFDCSNKVRIEIIFLNLSKNQVII